MAPISGVDFVSLPTRDLTQAADFYEHVVGLRRSKSWGAENPLGIEFETGTVTIALMDVERLGIEFAPHRAPIAFHVDDFPGTKAELESRGVTFDSDTIDSGVCWQVYFRDPDGNAIGIHHRYAA
jgi:catechol 2,3-dioxygenase-like lactoylglutathione lyase family enzyme